MRSGKIISDHYKERAQILIDLPLFSDALTKYTSKIAKLNANCNVAHLVSYLFADIPSCRATIVCTCGYLRRRQITELTVNLDILLHKGLQHMQEAVENALTTKITCRKCSLTCTEMIDYGPHLFIDTSIFTDNRYTNRDQTITHNFESIATTIKVNTKIYTLVGIVHYINASGDNVDNGHYVTYARCGTIWYEYDDVKKKRHIAKKNITITPHLIFYVCSEA